MARLDLTRRPETGTRNTTAPLNGALMTPVVSTDGAQFTLTGNERIFWRQTVASTRTITVQAVADDLGRDVDQTVSVAATIGHCGVLGPYQQAGWRQTDGKMYIDVSGDGIEMMVLTPS